MPEAVQDLQSYIAELNQVGAADRRYTVGVCGERASFKDEASSSNGSRTGSKPSSSLPRRI